MNIYVYSVEIFYSFGFFNRIYDLLYVNKFTSTTIAFKFLLLLNYAVIAVRSFFERLNPLAYSISKGIVRPQHVQRYEGRTVFETALYNTNSPFEVVFIYRNKNSVWRTQAV